MTDKHQKVEVRQTRKDAVLCPLCESAELVGRHCKTLCIRCGYVESCEDNFIPNTEAPPDDAPSMPERGTIRTEAV